MKGASGSIRWVISALLVAAFFPFTSHASIENWQRGANIMPQTNTDLASTHLQESLDDLKATGATYVGFIIPYYQADQNATVINRGGNTPNDDALISAVQYAHSIGLSVSLKMHVETHDHQWRAYINPTDRAAWFASYNTILQHYGTLAQTHDIEQIVIGTELINLSSDSVDATNTTNWRNLIASLRSIYDGSLTYGANWGDGSWTEEIPQIKFWDDLDYIGVSAYYWLSPTEDDSVESMVASWEDWNEEKLEPAHDEWNKPLLFTEIGYRSITGAHNHPWNWWDSGTFNEQEQANTYTALFSYWNTKDYFAGVMLWSWEVDPTAGGAGDTGYTPQNKQAIAIMEEWFINPPDPDPTSLSFSSDAGIINGAEGQVVEIPFSVTNTSSAAVDVLINIEIHSSNYQKIHQEFFTSQLFTAGETKTFSASWTPTNDGSYPIMVGIFKNDWSENYHWNGSAGTLVVGEDTPPPPPPAGDIDIWWPTDGSMISGTQPFKVLLSGRELETYDMFWQVEGGNLNEMDDSQQDYPHKESIVYIGGWTWQSDNNYELTFVAKELNGEEIANKSVTIIVAQ